MIMMIMTIMIIVLMRIPASAESAVAAPLRVRSNRGTMCSLACVYEQVVVSTWFWGGSKRARQEQKARRRHTYIDGEGVGGGGGGLEGIALKKGN